MVKAARCMRGNNPTTPEIEPHVGAVFLTKPEDIGRRRRRAEGEPKRESRRDWSADQPSGAASSPRSLPASQAQVYPAGSRDQTSHWHWRIGPRNWSTIASSWNLQSATSIIPAFTSTRAARSHASGVLWAELQAYQGSGYGKSSPATPRRAYNLRRGSAACWMPDSEPASVV